MSESTGEVQGAPFISEPAGSFAEESLTKGTSSALSTIDPLQYTRRLMRASAAGVSTYGETDPESGRQLTDPDEKLPVDVLEQMYSIPGKLKFDSPLPDEVARSMYQSKIGELRRQAAAERRPDGFIAGASTMGLRALADALDPLFIGSLFIPGIPEFELGSSVAARVGARALAGGASGAAMMAPLAGLNYGLGKAEQADYDAYQAMADIAVGAGLGAALHVGGGAFGDWLTSRVLKSKAGKLIEESPEQRETALGTVASQVLQDEPGDAAVTFPAHTLREDEPGGWAPFPERAPPSPDPYENLTPALRAEHDRLKGEAALAEQGGDMEAAASFHRNATGILEAQAARDGVAATDVTGFTTSKGSTYEVHEDGTTTRNKSYHPEHGVEDQGLKARSERTIYVDADQAFALSGAGITEHSGKGFRLILGDGRASLLDWNAEAGRWGIAPSSRDIPYSYHPEVGKAPIEMWKPVDDVFGRVAYANQHAGNPITEVRTGTPVPEAPPHVTDVPPEPDLSARTRKATPFETLHEPMSLVRFLRSDWMVGRPGETGTVAFHGGLKDVPDLGSKGGDIRAIVGGDKARGALKRWLAGGHDFRTKTTFRSLINNATGSNLDDATLRAWQAGYFPEHDQRPTIQQLLDALNDEINLGQKRYSADDQTAIDAYHAAMAHNAYVDDMASRFDIPTTDITREQFFDRLKAIMTPEDFEARIGEFEQEHERGVREFEDQAKEWLTEQPRDATDVSETHGQEPHGGFDAEAFYGIDQHRTLEDLEREYRQEAASSAAGEHAGGAGQRGPAAAPEGAGEAGAGLGGHGAGDAGREGAGRGEAPGAATDAPTSVGASAASARGIAADDALRRAGGERAPDPNRDAADRAVKETPKEALKRAERELADHEEFFRRGEAEGGFGDLAEDIRKELEDIQKLDQEAKDVGEGAMQAAACIARGLSGGET